MLATKEARHRRGPEGGGRRKGRTRYFGFVTKAVGQHFGFCVCFCHKLYFTSVSELHSFPLHFREKRRLLKAC